MNQERRQIKAIEQQVPTVRSCEVAVRFGRMSMDCKNFGFCRIEPAGKGKVPKGSNMMSATLSYLDGELRFEFNRRPGKDEVYRIYFESGIFLVEERYELSRTCCDLIGIDAFSIKKGEYPVIQYPHLSTCKVILT